MTPITEQWLRDAGFKWQQGERCPTKHWLLWLGGAIVNSDDRLTCSPEDLGVEVAQVTPDSEHWFCWVRADYACRYCRFVHVRHIKYAEAIVALIFGLTGRAFDPADAFYGSLRTPEQAARMRREESELHHRLAAEWGQRASPDHDKSQQGLLIKP